MRKYLKLKNYFLAVLLLSAGSYAVQNTPSQELLDYMIDFDDANGDVLDPLEFDQMTVIKTNGIQESSEELDMQKAENPINNPASSTQVSSTQSSLMMKGESL